jgi:hypothetical protein
MPYKMKINAQEREERVKRSEAEGSNQTLD